MTELKILMTAMSMDIGGAETHIYELICELKKNGAEVCLISNGGTYADRLAEQGIRHINAPLHTKNPVSMLKSVAVIKKAIREYKPDIIHAHARIPAFLSAKAARPAKIPLVSTTHGTFKITPVLKLLTDWGDYSLSVSGDITAYLMKNYKIPKGYITNTINGINTEVFCKKENQTVRTEFGISAGEKIILTASRLDRARYGGFAAYKLCAVAERLYKSYPDTRIIIVGDGENYGELKSLSADINGRIGKEYILMTGARSDIWNFMQCAEICVGISRTALEAIACGVPVILCGDMGWLGRFDGNDAGDCIKTNFTCRGFGYPDDLEDALFSELKYILDGGETDTVAGAEIVRVNYSAGRMADDALRVYARAARKYEPYDYVLTGYYGHENAGDDALLFTILNNIKTYDDNVKICVLASENKRLQDRINELYCNVIVKNKFNIFAAASAIKNSAALIFGGGTLLQDITSTKSLVYYTSLLLYAQKKGKKTYLYANGIGPLKNTSKVKKVMNGITAATIRDEQSYNLLKSILTDTDKIKLTADEVFTIKNHAGYTENNTFAMSRNIRYLCVCVRKWKPASNKFYMQLSSAIDDICRKHDLSPLFVIMEPKTDYKITYDLCKRTNIPFVSYNGDMKQILAAVQSAEVVISMRLHTLIFAAVCGKPMIGLSYDPKVEGMLRDLFGTDRYSIPLENFNKEDFLQLFEDVYSNKNTLSETIIKYTDEEIKKAEENIKILWKTNQE